MLREPSQLSEARAGRAPPRPPILRHAFTGKLVPQDPNDEPAGELLKRIAAERGEHLRVVAAAKRGRVTPKGALGKLPRNRR